MHTPEAVSVSSGTEIEVYLRKVLLLEQEKRLLGNKSARPAASTRIPPCWLDLCRR
jgi:hypothetical protein